MTKKQLKQDVAMLVMAVIGALLLGAVIFSATEGWHLLDAFYFVTMTATTVGYGDFTPTTAVSKVFTIIYSLSIVPFVLYAFSFVAKAQMNKVYTKVHHLEKQQKEQEKELDEAERKLDRQRRKLKQQEAELDEQEENDKKQLRAIKKQKKELEEHEKELLNQRRKLNRESKLNRLQEKEIIEHDAELETVEEVMEAALKN